MTWKTHRPCNQPLHRNEPLFCFHVLLIPCLLKVQTRGHLQSLSHLIWAFFFFFNSQILEVKGALKWCSMSSAGCALKRKRGGSKPHSYHGFVGNPSTPTPSTLQQSRGSLSLSLFPSSVGVSWVRTPVSFISS